MGGHKKLAKEEKNQNFRGKNLNKIIIGTLSSISLLATSSITVQAHTNTINQEQQDLGFVLSDFAKKHNLRILFKSDLVSGKKAKNITGNYTPDEYLERLLAGTGLDYLRVKKHSIYIFDEKTLAARRGYKALKLKNDKDHEEKLTVLNNKENEEHENYDEPVKIEEITVTGSRLRRNSYSSVDILRTIEMDNPNTPGFIDAADFIQKSTISAGRQQNITAAAGGSGVSGGSSGSKSVNLRGLGQNNTLVLVNGRSVPPGGIGATGAILTDLSTLPSAILKNIEILTQGASSIYGSEAVAGAVNYVTDKNLDGLKLSVSTRLPFKSGGEEYLASVAYGHQGENNSFIAAYEYYNQASLKWKDRPFSQCEDRPQINPDTGKRSDIDPATGQLKCFGQNTNYIDYNFGGLVPAKGAVAGGVSGYKELPMDNNFNIIGLPQDTKGINNADLIYNTKRHNLFISGHQELDKLGGITLYFESGYAKRTTTTHDRPGIFNIRVLETNDLNPWSINAAKKNTNITPSDVIVNILNRFFENVGQTKLESFRIVTGAKGILPWSDWSWNLDYQFGHSVGTLTRTFLRASRVKQAMAFKRNKGVLTCVDKSNGCVPFNVFDAGVINGTKINPALNKFLVATDSERTTTKRHEFTASFDGSLFEIPAGDVIAAFGVHFKHDKVNHELGSLIAKHDIFGNLSPIEAINNAKRNTLGIFAEAELPLVVGASWADEIVVNLSGRYTRDGKFNNLSYKTSLRYKISPTLTLRGSYSTSFRAPDLAATSRNVILRSADDIVNTPFVDPCSNWGAWAQNQTIRANCQAQGLSPNFMPTGRLLIQEGANKDLKAETGRSLVIGAVWQPEALNLQTSISYYNIKIKDTIVRMDPYTILIRCYKSVGLKGAFCDPSLLGARLTSGVRKGELTSIDARDRNSGKSGVSGIDFELNGFIQLGEFQISYGGEVSYLLSRTTQSQITAPIKNLEGAIGYAKWRANGLLSAKYQGFGLSYGVRYFGSVDEAVLDRTFFATPRGKKLITKIAPFMSHNITGSYNISEDSFLSLTIMNLFNKKPPSLSELPFVTDQSQAFRSGNVPYGAGYDILGRTVSLKLITKF